MILKFLVSVSIFISHNQVGKIAIVPLVPYNWISNAVFHYKKKTIETLVRLFIFFTFGTLARCFIFKTFGTLMRYSIYKNNWNSRAVFHKKTFGTLCGVSFLKTIGTLCSVSLKKYMELLCVVYFLKTIGTLTRHSIFEINTLLEFLILERAKTISETRCLE